MVGWVITTVGILATLGMAFGIVNLIKPIPRLGIPDRPWAAAVVAMCYLVLVVASILFPSDFAWPWNR